MTTQIHLMRSLYLKALTLAVGMLPVALACITFATAVAPAHVAHATGPCKWEGGTGAPATPDCEAVDCIGRGGEALCSAGEPAVATGYSDSQVKPDKWVYGAGDDYYNPTFTNPYWCWSVGGQWVGDGWLHCINFPSDLISERMSNDEGRILSIAADFANMWLTHMGCSGASETSDTGWVSPYSSLGILVSNARTKHYQGNSCSQSINVIFARTRAAQCQSTAQARTAVTGPECVIPQGMCPVMSNPVSLVTGAKIQRESDYVSAADTGLEFSRYYASNRFYWPTYLIGANAPDHLAATDYWKHSYERSFIPVTGNSEVSAIVRRPDCTVLVFDASGVEKTRRGGTYGTGATLATVAGGWNLTLANSDIEHYDSAGRLVSITKPSGRVTTLTYAGPNGQLSAVTGPFGHTLTLAYNSDQLLASVTLPDQGVITYGYDAYLRPVSVTYPDGKSRQYGYGHPVRSWLLTSITDENGTQFGSYVYDAQGRVTSESHAGGADPYTFAYSNSGGVISTTVTDPNGAATQFIVAIAKGMYRPGSYSAACASCGSTASHAYDSSGNTTTRTDFNGNQTSYTFDTTRNLETARTEASGTPRARTISTTWDSTFRLPSQIDEPGRRTTYGYDSHGNVLTRTVTDTVTNSSRTWTYTYNGSGQVLTIDGPRTDVSDVTTFTYNSCTSGAACGQLATVTDAAGNLTSFTSYNAHGQPLSMTDPNGTITTLAYDARQRLTSRTTAGETTTFDYWPTGLMKKVTQPDGSFAQYDYDAAHRLTKITDTAGNTINYTLDGAGNRTAEVVRDASNTVVRSMTRTFNSLGRVLSEKGSANQTTSYTYNGAGQVITTSDPYGRETGQAYDELGRLASITDPALGLTQLAYDGVDNLVSVTDPRALVTSYAYNGLGDQTTLTSPDTGTTGYTFNAAGAVAQATDARSKTGTYSYDAVGRVSSIAYTDQTIAFTYDQTSTGRGHLTQLVDGAGTTQWSYDSWGRVTARAQTTGSVSLTVGYSYDTQGRPASLTTPSGQTVAYSYDAAGRVSGLTVNAATLLSGVTYQPFGPITGWTWGNSTSMQRTYDTDGQLTALSSAGSSTFTYFPDGRIQSRTDDFAGAAPGSSGMATFTTASTSNRVQSVTGLLTRTYSYDSAGHTTSDGSRTFTYNDAGRMKTSTAGGITTTYSYSGLGERLKKSNPNATVYFAYDEAGHTVGEYGSTGNLIQETVWFANIPVATIRPNGGGAVKVYYVHTDQLNTPRRVTDPATNTVIWRWESDPFGGTVAQEDPDGDTVAFIYNLRFPGQYFDAETALNYNYLRDYDPVTGRYVESDPIGLGGGINTYAYTKSNPIGLTDPDGRQADVLPPLVRPFPVPEVVPRPIPGPRPFPGMVDPAMPMVPPDTGVDDASDVDDQSLRHELEQCPRDCRGLLRQLRQHEEKLRQYQANPDAYDNLGLLTYAPPGLRQAIINGRIRNLERQIENFRRQYEQCLRNQA